jgi:hypothetical protein
MPSNVPLNVGISGGLVEYVGIGSSSRDLVVVHAVGLHDKILKSDPALRVSVALSARNEPLGYLLITTEGR